MVSERIKEYQRRYRAEHKNDPEYKAKAQARDAHRYREKREKILAQQKSYRDAMKANDPEKYQDSLEKRRRYKKRNRHKIRKYQNKRVREDLNFRLARLLRSRIRHAVRGNSKIGSAVQDLGCSVEELKMYLEHKFQFGMSWDNYGEWHVDHILPLSRFDLTDRKQFKKACRFTNLQPLWAEDNLRKGNKCPEESGLK